MKRKRPRAQRETSAGGVVFRRGPDGGPRFLLIRDSYEDLALRGPIRVIDWYFRFRGKTIHKFCHFFLFESRRGECVPQTEEGITDCAWYAPEEARRTISYDNARAVLEQATAMVQALAHVTGRSTPEQPA